MNLEKYTDRAKGFIQAAQTVAIRMNHQRIAPEHLLKALLEDSEGMAAGLMQRAGGNPQIAVNEVDKALGKIAAVTGVPPGTVRSRLHYAKRHLKRFIEEKRP